MNVNDQSSTFKLLSIDGGGIRGIIPGTVLIEVERMLQEKYGNNLKLGDYFDFIAGTSTGGILTCLYLAPDPNNPGKAKFSAEDARKLYLDHGDKIFDRGIWQKISSGWGVTDEKYDAKQLESALARYLTTVKLSELIKPCLITGFDLRLYKPVFYTQHDACDPRYDYLVRDVARATSAGPTYFEPAMPESLDDIPNATPVVDGGVFANNPTACALVEAITKGRGAKKGSVPVKDIVILSLGTGTKMDSYTFTQCKDWGLAGWVKPLLGILMDGVAQTVDFQLKTIFAATGKGDQYLRINGEFSDYQHGLDIPGLDPSMDNASVENMRKLKQFGEQLASNYKDDLQAFVNNYL